MPTMPQTLKPLSMHKAPFDRAQPIAFHDGKLWLGSLSARRLLAIDVQTWSVVEEVELPGESYGLASFDGAIHVVVSIGPDDDRYIYRLTPGTVVSDSERVACPDFTGSHLTTDGQTLYLVQQSKRCIIELDKAGATKREIPMPTRCAGAAFDGKTLYMITADEEFDVLELATFDLHTPNAKPAVLAAMHIEDRGLAFDGTAWWTSRRELGDIVSFKVD